MEGGGHGRAMARRGLLGLGFGLFVFGIAALVLGLGLAQVGPRVAAATDGAGDDSPIALLEEPPADPSPASAKEAEGIRATGGVLALAGLLGAVLGAVVYAVGREHGDAAEPA